MIGVTVLGSGSRGNSLVVHGEDGAILVDAGFSMRQTRIRLEEAGVDIRTIKAIVVSHEHTDHVKGLRVAAKQLKVPVYCNRNTGTMLKDREICPDTLHLFSAGASFMIGEFMVQPFSIPHDAMDPVGFTISNRDMRVGIATDLGHVNNLVCHHLRESEILVVESNHDLNLLRRSSRPWSLKQRILSRHGHLSNDATLELLARVLHERTRHLILAHASQDCNRYDLVASHVSNGLKALGRTDLTPHVATQDKWLPTMWAAD